ncbi:MAG TPA: hypothetical protein VL860_05415 [Planctomycetota bacterium]|nr:hypothetical protein [Planctomycetota bacterium]
MSRHFLFIVSALLFLSLFGKLAWEVHKESSRTAQNDIHAIDPYFLHDAAPYTKQVYDITVTPADQKGGTGLQIGTLIREIKEDDSPNTKLITETYNFRPPGGLGSAAQLDAQCQTSLNSLIGLQNVEWDVFLRLNKGPVDFGLYYHLKAGPPSNLDLPVRSEVKLVNNGFLDPTTFLPGEYKLAARSGDAPSQIVKTDDFQLNGICFSPFTQRTGVSLYDNWPVKYLKPEDLSKFNTKEITESGSVPFRLGRVVITDEVDAQSPANGESVIAYRAVCKLEHRIEDKANAEEFRLEALYLADGTVLEVQTITASWRLTARLQHIVVNWKKPQDPEIGSNTSASRFDKHQLYLKMFPELEMLNPGAEDTEALPPPTSTQPTQPAQPVLEPAPVPRPRVLPLPAP